MRLVSEAGARLRRAAEEEEREPPPIHSSPSHRSNHQFASMKSKFFDELTHLPSEHKHKCIKYTRMDNANTMMLIAVVAHSN